MSGVFDKDRLDANGVAMVLAAHGFGVDRPRAGAVLLALTEPLRIAWANRAATDLFGADDPSGLFTRIFTGEGRNGLAEVVRRLVPGGGPRTERLRLFQGFRARTVPVTISLVARPFGQEDVIVLAVPPLVGDGVAEDAFAVDALRVEASPPQAVEPAAIAPCAAEPEIVAPGPRASAGRPPRGRDLRRFLWQTDVDHRLVALSAVPAELDGLGVGTPIGEGLTEIAGRLGADPDGTLAAALATGEPFSGLRLSWPLAGGRNLVETSFGAVPVKGLGGVAMGFRGFGIADLSSVAASPPQTSAGDDMTIPADAAPASSPLPDAAMTADEPVTLEPLAPAREDDIWDMRRAATPTMPRASFNSAKVVALRPFQSQAVPESGPAAPPARRRSDASAESLGPSTAAAPVDAADLTSVERLNFDEIARALRDGVGAADGARDIEADDGAALLAALPLGLLVDCSGRVVFVNAAFAAMTGYPSGPALDQAGGIAHLLGGVEVAAVAGSGEDRMFPIVGADGGVVTVEGRVGVIPWGGRQADLLTLRPAVDAAAERHALRLEAQRRAEEAAEQRDLLGQVSEAVLSVDRQGRVLAVNGAAERLFGRDEGSLAGESLGALLTPECQNAALGAIFAAGTAGPDAPASPLSVIGRRRGGENLPLQMTLRALGSAKVGIVLRDVSEAQDLNEEMLRLRAEADDTSNVRSDFLAKVSHEIRTPLNAIIGFAEIMLDERFGPVGNARYKDYLNDIRTAGQTVIDLVADLLDLSTMQAGRKTFAPTSTDVNRIVGQSVAEMQGLANRDRIIVRQSLSPHLPNALVDETALRQVMDNILSNAIRFNEPGGQVIVSTALVDRGAITVRVRDTGVGMSEAELAVAMEPFREISTGKPGGGSGLGLPLARALVEANQATMSIKSRKDDGTLVEIVLPPAPHNPHPMRVPAA